MTKLDLIVIIAASCAGMCVKSVTGMGYPLFAIPIIAMLAGIEDAVVMVAAPNTVANVILNLRVRKARTETRDLVRLAGSAAGGAVVGTFLLVSLPEKWLLAVLALTISVFIYSYLRVPNINIGPALSRRWSPAVGSLAGVMQGAVGLSGPVAATWLFSYRLSRDAYIYALTTLLSLASISQLLLLIGRGEYDRDRTLAAGLALIPVLVLIPIGERLRQRLSGPAFERSVLAVLVLSVLGLAIRLVN